MQHSCARLQAALLRAVIIAIIVGGQLLLNVHLSLDPGSFCRNRVLQPVVNGLVWVSWNTLLCLLVIESHNTNLLPSNQRGHDSTVQQLPAWRHWPKLLIWLPCTGVTCSLATAAASLPTPRPLPVRGCAVRGHVSSTGTLSFGKGTQNLVSAQSSRRAAVLQIHCSCVTAMLPWLAAANVLRHSDHDRRGTRSAQHQKNE